MKMVTALVLAAGESKRSQPVMKQLYPVQGTALIDFVVKKLAATRVDRIRVVLGYNREEVRRAIRREAISKELEVVVNEEPERGMLSSIRRGLTDEDSYLIFPVDHPLVQVETMDMLIRAAERQSAPAVIVPVFGGRRGHPVLIPKSMFEDLRDFNGGSLADFIHARNVQAVEVDDAGVVTNFNTLEQLQKLDKLSGD